MEQNNPFKAPEAHVADFVGESGDFIPEGRKVPAGHGAAWFSKAWELFRQAPGTWVGIAVVNFLIMIALAVVPVIGNLASSLLTPIFIGGIMLGCKALEEGNELTVAHLFSGFSEHGGNLALAGLLYLAGLVAIVITMIAIGAILGIGGGLSGSKGMVFAGLGVAALLGVLCVIPLAMALWFAPALIIFHELTPFEAMKASFFACLKNFLPFLIYSLVFAVLAVLATLPVFLGWLVLTPVILASIYAGYRDMFLRD